MFSLQIYFDFSGYSDMAIGLGRMFGFHFHENFNYPYIAKNATDFWRRWHISLGTFFRDYVYIPLGGNRKRGYTNLFIVWALTGLWHGASWNFVLWGLYFGVLILLERLFLFKFLEKLPRLLSHLYLLFVVVLGWALFYFEDFNRLISFFQLIFGGLDRPGWDFKLSLLLQEHAFWLFLTLLLCLPIFPKLHQFWEDEGFAENVPNLTWMLTWALQFLLLGLSIALLVGNSYNPFIYYRF
jgi:alginate O-acetyltransferase complex protein AlgI